MSKKNKTIFNFYIDSLKMYFSNFAEFIKYMTFPVLGQVFGLILIFILVFIYSKNMPELIEKYPVLNNFSLLILISILITLPGLLILIKAFWEYLISYGAINSMYDNMKKSGKVYDFNAHTELIKRRIIPYIGLWALTGIFCIIAYFPLFWIPAGILTIFFILIFQVFTFKPELSVIGCFKKSFNLIKGHFASTFFLACICLIVTYITLPQLFLNLLEKISFIKILGNWISPLLYMLPIQEINHSLSKLNICVINIIELSDMIIRITITQIIIQYTLPMRSILWCIWYDELNKNSTVTNKKIQKTSCKTKNKKEKLKPSEKLMIESNRKFSTKKLDRNILKRAMEKNDYE